LERTKQRTGHKIRTHATTAVLDGDDHPTIRFAGRNAKLPALRHGFDGPFVLKAFLGGTGRANSCCSLDPAPDPGLADRIARIEATYHRLGLPSRFRSTPLDPPGLAALLLARGYAPDREESVVYAGYSATIRMRAARQSR
jgi:hypothetical protein